jgi:hypothetical protein
MFERLKKLWQEAKQKAADEWDKEHTVFMPPAVFENTHETMAVDLSLSPNVKDIDTEIAVLVAEMNRVGIHTTCSCQGHDGGEAYISIRLGEGTTYEHRKDIFGPGQDELTLKWCIK